MSSRNNSSIHTCTTLDDLSGSIEVIVQPSTSSLNATSTNYNHDDGTSTKSNNNSRRPPKPIKQLSRIIRKMKPPTVVRRNRTIGGCDSYRDRNKAPVHLRKVQSVIVTPRSSTTSSQSSSSRHVRCNSDFDVYHHQRTPTSSNEAPEKLLGCDEASHGFAEEAAGNTNGEEIDDILLVSSSVSSEDGAGLLVDGVCGDLVKKSPSGNDFVISSSFYNLVKSSWGGAEVQDYDKENVTPAKSQASSFTKNRSDVYNTSSSSSNRSSPRATSLVWKASALHLMADDTDSIIAGGGDVESGSGRVDFFFKEDFDSSIWTEVNATSGISILGAAVMTATVVIHPLVFVAGAATAVWAVGFLHGLEKG